MKYTYLKRLLQLNDESKLDLTHLQQIESDPCRSLGFFWHDFADYVHEPHYSSDRRIRPLRDKMINITCDLLPEVSQYPITVREILYHMGRCNIGKWNKLIVWTSNFSQAQRKQWMDTLDAVVLKFSPTDIALLLYGLARIQGPWTDFSDFTRAVLKDSIVKSKLQFSSRVIADFMFGLAFVHVWSQDLEPILGVLEDIILSAPAIRYSAPQVHLILEALNTLRLQVKNKVEFRLSVAFRKRIDSELEKHLSSYDKPRLIRLLWLLVSLDFRSEDLNPKTQTLLIQLITFVQEEMSGNDVIHVLLYLARLSISNEQLKFIAFPSLSRGDLDFSAMEPNKVKNFMWACRVLEYPLAADIKAQVSTAQVSRQRREMPKPLGQVWLETGYTQDPYVQNDKIRSTLRAIENEASEPIVEFKKALPIFLHYFARVGGDWHQHFTAEQQHYLSRTLADGAPDFTPEILIYTVQALEALDFDWSNSARAQVCGVIMEAVKRCAPQLDFRQTAELLGALANFDLQATDLQEIQKMQFAGLNKPIPATQAAKCLLELFEAQQILHIAFSPSLQGRINEFKPEARRLTGIEQEISAELTRRGFSDIKPRYVKDTMCYLLVSFFQQKGLHGILQKYAIIVENPRNYTRTGKSQEYRPKPRIQARDNLLVGNGWKIAAVFPTDWQANHLSDPLEQQAKKAELLEDIFTHLELTLPQLQSPSQPQPITSPVVTQATPLVSLSDEKMSSKVRNHQGAIQGEQGITSPIDLTSTDAKSVGILEEVINRYTKTHVKSSTEMLWILADWQYQWNKLSAPTRTGLLEKSIANLTNSPGDLLKTLEAFKRLKIHLMSPPKNVKDLVNCMVKVKDCKSDDVVKMINTLVVMNHSWTQLDAAAQRYFTTTIAKHGPQFNAQAKEQLRHALKKLEVSSLSPFKLELPARASQAGMLALTPGPSGGPSGLPSSSNSSSTSTLGS